MQNKRTAIPLLLLLLAGCIAPHVISPTACDDPKYLQLKTKPFDLLTPTEREYYALKDAECEQAQAAANAVEQTQRGEQEDIFLDVGLIAIAVALILAAGIIH